MFTRNDDFQRGRRRTSAFGRGTFSNDIAGVSHHNSSMAENSDYRHELSLRDEQLRRELDMRHEAALREQAIRDKAWEERFAGFLSAQAERDKRLDESTASIKSDISKLGSLKVNIWGAMATAVGTILAIAALCVAVYGIDRQSQSPTSASASAASQPAPVTKPAE